MPTRTVWIERREAGGIIDKRGGSMNDVHADAAIEHTLVKGKRYVVSPISANKATKLRGRSCEFLKPRLTSAGDMKARVRFEDDGSQANVDPVDLLPYDGEEVLGAGLCLVQKESAPSGPVSEMLSVLLQKAKDYNQEDYRDKFRVLVATWFLKEYLQLEKVDPELITEIDGKLMKILGPGHHLQSCLQFLTGKRGKQALANLMEHGSGTQTVKSVS
jgi:hypothetical protein